MARKERKKHLSDHHSFNHSVDVSVSNREKIGKVCGGVERDRCKMLERVTLRAPNLNISIQYFFLIIVFIFSYFAGQRT